jgi:hypothetical protein
MKVQRGKNIRFDYKIFSVDLSLFYNGNRKHSRKGKT